MSLRRDEDRHQDEIQLAPPVTSAIGGCDGGSFFVAQLHRLVRDGASLRLVVCHGRQPFDMRHTARSG